MPVLSVYEKELAEYIQRVMEIEETGEENYSNFIEPIVH